METKRDLSGLRNEVRELDKELVKLFEKRMHLCRLIGESKLKAEVPIYDARREEENIEQVVSVIQKTIDKSHFIKWYIYYTQQGNSELIIYEVNFLSLSQFLI